MVGVLGMLRTVGARAGAKLAPGPVGQVLEPDEGANGVNERPFALDDVLASSEMIAADSASGKRRRAPPRPRQSGSPRSDQPAAASPRSGSPASSSRPRQLLFFGRAVSSCSLLIRAFASRNWFLIHCLSCKRLCLASAV